MFRHIHTLSAVAAFALSLGSASAFAATTTYDFSTAAAQGVTTP